MKLEIRFDGRALVLVAGLLFFVGGAYFGWRTFQSGLELRQQTKWIKALSQGATASDLEIPPSERYGVTVMAQMAMTSRLSEADWQKFEAEARNQMRDGALYIAGSLLLAALALVRTARKVPRKRLLLPESSQAREVEPRAIDKRNDL